MRYVVIGDLHLADRPPAMRTDSYAEDILAKLQYVMARTRELQADALIITGDVFHRKVPAHTSHRLVQRVRDILYGTRPVYIVPGNHDLGADGLRNGGFGQPFYSLFGENVRMLLGNAVAPSGDPYIAGVPWYPEFAEEPPGVAARIRKSVAHGCGAAPLLFMHAPIVLEPNPFGPEERGWVTAGEVAAVLPPHVKLVVAGHIHSGHLPVTIRGVAFANPGALSRGSIADSDRDRTPQLAVMDFNPAWSREDPAGRATVPVTVSYEQVPHRPADQVFLTAERAADLARRDIAGTLSRVFEAAYAEVVTRESLVLAVMAAAAPGDVDEALWREAQQMAVAALEEQS